MTATSRAEILTLIERILHELRKLEEATLEDPSLNTAQTKEALLDALSYVMRARGLLPR